MEDTHCGICNKKGIIDSGKYTKCGICRKWYHDDHRKCGIQCPRCEGLTCNECAKPCSRTIKHTFHKDEIIRETICTACFNSQQ